jgi:hypothetical protein
MRYREEGMECSAGFTAGKPPLEIAIVHAVGIQNIVLGYCLAGIPV